MSKLLKKRAWAKKLLVLLSVFLFLLLFSPAVSAAAMLGDVDDNETIDVRDVVLVMKHVLDILPLLTAAQQAVADVDGINNITIQDVNLIMQYTLGIIDEFPVPATLAVTSVKAVNLREIEILFNRMLKTTEKAEAVKFSSIQVYKQGALTTDIFTAGEQAAATVLADNKTVRVTLKNNNFLANYTTANKIVVKKEVGMTADYVKTDLAVSDTAVPTLVSVESIGTNKIVLTFSEVLDSTVVPTNVLLNDGTIGLNLAVATYVDSQRQLIIDSDFAIPTGTNTIKINVGTSLRDAALFNVVPVSKTFTHTPLTGSPTATVKESTEFTVTLLFSRMINPATIINNSNVLFTHTHNTVLNQVDGFAVTNPSGDQRTFVVTFGNPLPPGTATVWMKYTDTATDAQKIKDYWGNIVAPASFTVTTTPDTTGPTATVSPVAGSNIQIDIQYSKPVQIPLAMDPANYILKKGTIDVPFTGPVNLGSNRYRITATAAMQGTHTLTIQNIKDTTVAQNPMGTQTYTVNIPDTIAPFITAPDNTTAGTNFYWQPVAPNSKVRIYFSEAMNATDLADKTKYLNAADANANPTLATPAGNGLSVYLEFANNVTGNLVVGSVRDLAGNPIAGFSATLTGAPAPLVGLDTTIVPAANRVISESISTVKIHLNDIVSGATKDDFEVDKGDGIFRAPEGILVSTVGGKSVITLTLPVLHQLEYDTVAAEVRTVSAPATPGSTTNAKNAYGIPVNFAATDIADRIAPVVDKIWYVSPTKILVTFKEDLLPGSIAALGLNGFSVGGGGTLTTAVVHLVDDDVMVLTGTNFTINTDVIYNAAAAEIRDKATPGNHLAGFSRFTALDNGQFILTSPAPSQVQLQRNYEPLAGNVTAATLVALALNNWVDLAGGGDLEARFTTIAPANFTDLILTPTAGNNPVITITGTRPESAVVVSTIMTVEIRDKYSQAVRAFTVQVSGTGVGTTLTIGAITIP